MTTQNKPIAWLFNPSVYVAGAPALGLGFGAILLAALVGWQGNTHFDGVLDAHAGMHSPFWTFLVEGILDWLCVALVLLVLGRIVSRTAFRTVDVLGTQPLARWPTLFISLALLPKVLQRFANGLLEQLRQGEMPKINPADTFVVMLSALAVAAFFCWMLELMYKAFSVSCNLKGGKAIGTFIGGILIAEVISKICVGQVLEHAAPNQADAAGSGGPALMFSPSVTARGDSDDLSAAGAALVDLLAAKEFAAAEARFDPAMQSAMPEARLHKVWEDLLATAGPYRKQLRTRVEKQAGYDVVLVTCQFDRELLDMKVVFDSQKRVTGLFYVPAQTTDGAFGGASPWQYCLLQAPVRAAI